MQEMKRPFLECFASAGTELLLHTKTALGKGGELWGGGADGGKVGEVVLGWEGWVAGAGGRRDHRGKTRNGLLLTEGGGSSLIITSR